MRHVPLSSIEIRKRQRSSIDAAALTALRESIRGRGLLHPPVAWLDEASQRYILVVGERRFKAVEALAAAEIPITCDGEDVPLGSIPITAPSEFLDEAGLFEAELDENLHREDLTWQDRVAAFAALHEMRKTQNPDQTFRETGREVIRREAHKNNPRVTDVQSAGRLIRRSVILAERLNDPKIQKARNADEAFQLLMKAEEEATLAAIARRRIASLPSRPEIEVRHGDSNIILPSLESGHFDLLIADPPYGINAGSGGFRGRTVHHHNYDDTLADARNLAQLILTEGFRLTKPRSNIFIFTDIKHWEWLQAASANMGWTPFRTPIIWQKSESEGLAPWGSAGFRRTYEIIFYATKGERGLLSSPVDVLTVKRVPRHERIHAAEKPVELLTRLIEAATLPGDLVLDPCCGSGSTLVAARDLKRRALGIERDLDYYNTAMANVHATPVAEPTDAVAG